MNTRKFFRRTISALFIAAILLVNAAAHAEIYIGEGSYVMSKFETLEVSRERAKADAMRNACEQAGVYVRNYSRERNFKLEEDVIETMTVNIIQLVETPQFSMLEQVDNLEGVLIRCTVKAQIDDSDINRWINKPSDEIATLVAQNEALRKANAELERQLAELKRQVAQAVTAPEKERLTQEFVNEDNKFLSNQKVDDARKLYSQNDYSGAVKLFDEAIQLNSNNSEAWRGRGTAYSHMEQYERAMQDFDKALELNPNDGLAQLLRKFCLEDMSK